MNIKRNAMIGVMGLLLLLAGLYLGRYGLPSPDNAPAAKESGAMNGEEGDRQVLYWYDPMYPQHRFEEPGPSPFMDMDLVPRYAGGGGSDQPAVQVEAAMVQSLGIRSALVTSTRTQSRLEATGLVAFNDRALTRLQSPSMAFVDKAWPLAEGDTVRRGQPLLRLRVPAWTGAQHEWLAVLDSGDSALIASGRERLRSLGMPVALISSVERQRQLQDTWTVTAPHDGVIRTLDARAGMTLAAGASMAGIQSLDPVWIEIAMPERQVGQVRNGDVVAVIVQGAQREGRVAEILPQVNQATRTVSVRVILPNGNGELRPGMSAQVRIQGEGEQKALAVPTEALLHTGQRTLVMLDEGEGRYRPQAVQPGAELGEQTLIQAGLEEGQKVVVSGQFLLDSEASLQGIAIQEMAPPNATDGPGSLHYAEGVVEQLVDGKVRLRHGPFETLGMPAMSMRFRLANEQVAEGIAVGDRVRIGVRDTDDGLIVVSLDKQAVTP